jgi:hypothetical protein
MTCKEQLRWNVLSEVQNSGKVHIGEGEAVINDHITQKVCSFNDL